MTKKLKEAYLKNCHSYNLRCRKADVHNASDRVWKRNYVLSDASKYFSSKLAPRFIECVITNKVPPLVYQLADESVKDIGRWHVKDLKPWWVYPKPNLGFSKQT